MKAKSLLSDTQFKTSIRNIVSAYRVQKPEEYRLVCQAVEMQRQLLQDAKYGAMESTDNRALYEISMTLQENFIINLSVDALTWLKSKQGGRWFAKEFKEFALPSHI